MAASVGAAAAQGLESGLNLGLRMRSAQRDDEERARRRQLEDEDRATAMEDRTLQRQRQAEADARTKRTDERQALQDSMRALDAEHADIQAEGQTLFQTHGGFDKVPEDVRTDYVRRSRDLRDRRAAARRQLYAPSATKMREHAAETWSRVAAGQMRLEDVPDDELYSALTAQTQRPLTDFLRPAGGGASPVGQAARDVEAGMQTGNKALMLKGANVLLAPELRAGVGTAGQDGSEILEKRIFDFVPHPDQPGMMVPLLEVFTRREDGALGRYVAPATEGRGAYAADPSAVPKAISLQAAMDRVGQLGALEAAVNRPDMRSRIERASPQAKASAEEFLSELGIAGVKMPAKSQVTWHTVPAGGMVIGTDPAGNIVNRTDGPAKPAAGGAGGAGGLAGTISAINGMVQRGEIDETTAAGLRLAAAKRQATGLKGGAGGAGGGGAPAAPKGATGEEVLRGLSEDDATVIRSLADGSVSPKDISEKGNRRERMLALAKRFDPTAEFGPNGRLKDVPAPAQKAMLENDTNMRRAELALRLVGGAQARPGETVDSNATGLKGYLPNVALNRLDPKGVEARAAIGDLGSLVIHDRSGAAVTASEFPRLAPFIPGATDDAETVKKKLRRFVEVYRAEQDALQAAYSKDNGFKTFKVGLPQPAATVPAPARPAPQTGGATGGWGDSAPAQPGAQPSAAAPLRTATNPKTGQKLVLKDGQWVPLQ